MKNIKEIVKGNPLEVKDGVWYFKQPPADMVSSRDQNPTDKGTWSYWRRQNYIFLEEELGALPKDSVLIDLGAGQSDFGELTQAFNLCAVDLYPYPGVSVVCDFQESLPFKDASVDVLLLSNLLEHVREPNTFLTECYRILKPGGVLLGTVPFMIQVHQRPYDFYRYTDINLKYLFGKHRFRKVAVTPVSNLYVLLFNVGTSFFAQAIKEARFKFLWRVFWKAVRIKLFLLRKFFEKRLSDPDSPLGYLFKAYR